MQTCHGQKGVSRLQYRQLSRPMHGQPEQIPFNQASYFTVGKRQTDIQVSSLLRRQLVAPGALVTPTLSQPSRHSSTQIKE